MGRDKRWPQLIFRSKIQSVFENSEGVLRSSKELDQILTEPHYLHKAKLVGRRGGLHPASVPHSPTLSVSHSKTAR